MSLLDDYMYDCVILNETIVDDGYGGHVTKWPEGATFKAAIDLNTSMQARIGEKQGVTALYTITTSKDLVLTYHKVIKRLSDGKIFRVTSNGTDKHTPKSATLNMTQVSAEEWELPVNE